jgi:hypothetical protein
MVPLLSFLPAGVSRLPEDSAAINFAQQGFWREIKKTTLLKVALILT